MSFARAQQSVNLLISMSVESFNNASTWTADTELQLLRTNDGGNHSHAVRGYSMILYREIIFVFPGKTSLLRPNVLEGDCRNSKGSWDFCLEYLLSFFFTIYVED